MMGAFFAGAALSAGAGYAGMMVATDGNVRTTVACTAGTLNDGLRCAPSLSPSPSLSLSLSDLPFLPWDALSVAFTTGAIMGFTVVGLGLGGVSLMYLLLGIGNDYENAETMQVLTGFGFGASSIALFARVAGGIYTKAADVGADLVGKVSQHPRRCRVREERETDRSSRTLNHLLVRAQLHQPHCHASAVQHAAVSLPSFTSFFTALP